MAVADDSLQALRVSESRYRRLFETARDGILLLNADTAQIEDVNPYLIEMLGYSHAQFLGRKLWEVGAFADVAQSKEMFAELQQKGYVRYEDLPLRTSTGARLEVEFVSNAYDCEGVTVIQCNIRDISERKRLEGQLREMAFHDELTQLPNRRLLLDRLQQAIQNSDRLNHYGAVLFIDLDRFKQLNDTHGHEAGDQLLVQLAARLRQVVRGMDSVARVGGDEFVVLLEGVGEKRLQAETDSAAVATKVSVALSAEYLLGDLHYQITCSIGSALFRGADCNADEILKAADLAMYAQKHRIAAPPDALPA
jgi:diguanylate cyclase (GGDEF)-like protein/PAS domain S-box-containing protein